MKKNKAPTWIIGDGTLMVDSLNVMVRRLHSQPIEDGKRAHDHETQDRWIISATHDDGRDREVTTSFQLEQNFSGGKSRTTVSMVSNNLGGWDTGKALNDINLEEPLRRNLGLSPDQECLLRVVKGLYDATGKMCNFTLKEGTPFSHTEEVGTTSVHAYDDVRIKIADAMHLGFADVGQVLTEALAGDMNALTMRMNSHPNTDENERQQHALRVRHEDAIQSPLPDGATYKMLMTDLVSAGLSIDAAYPDMAPEYNRSAPGGDSALVRMGTTSILAEAVTRNDVSQIATLMQMGADPLLELHTDSWGKRTPTTPFHRALQSGQGDVIAAIVSNADERDSARVVDAYKAIKEPVSREAETLMNAVVARVHVLNELRKNPGQSKRM